MTPDKANKLHDDRSYTCSMASYALMCERRKFIMEKQRKKADISQVANMFKVRAPKSSRRF